MTEKPGTALARELVWTPTDSPMGDKDLTRNDEEPFGFFLILLIPFQSLFCKGHRTVNGFKGSSFDPTDLPTPPICR